MTDVEGTEMSEYIERKALEKALTAAAANDKDKNCRTWAKAICILHDAPSVDAVPVMHGAWKPDPHCYNVFHCSACDSPFWAKRNYCPNCGAKMDLEGEDQ